jgi:allophanate hydrolase subunit 2
MALEVRVPGLQTTVQDEGRIGLYAAGMPPSGAMDKASYRVGNLLVGNPDGLASLEITYLGPQLEV